MGRFFLTSLRTRGIILGLDILFDIGAFAEKEVIREVTVYFLK